MARAHLALAAFLVVACDPGGNERVHFPADAGRVGFSVDKATGGHEGHFDRFTASALLIDGELASMWGRVDVTSLRTDSSALTADLVGRNFFDVVRHPEARFVSTHVAEADPEANAYLVRGELTLRGVTKEATAPVTIDISESTVRMRAEIPFEPEAYGIELDRDAEMIDAVTIEIDVSAPRR